MPGRYEKPMDGVREFLPSAVPAFIPADPVQSGRNPHGGRGGRIAELATRDVPAGGGQEVHDHDIPVHVQRGRALATILKIGGNIQLASDGQTVSGTQEVVVMNRDGRTMATAPGGTFTGVRLSPEIAGDCYEFQNR